MPAKILPISATVAGDLALQCLQERVPAEFAAVFGALRHTIGALTEVIAELDADDPGHALITSTLKDLATITAHLERARAAVTGPTREAALGDANSLCQTVITWLNRTYDYEAKGDIPMRTLIRALAAPIAEIQALTAAAGNATEQEARPLDRALLPWKKVSAV
jgi:hypothetical protein